MTRRQNEKVARFFSSGDCFGGYCSLLSVCCSCFVFADHSVLVNNMYDEMMEWFELLVILWYETCNKDKAKHQEATEQLLALGAELINGIWSFNPEGE